jgi:hypothetical protein
MSLGIFKKAFNSTQISDLTAYFSTIFLKKNYMEYVALIGQEGSDAPSATVITDDFNGAISFSRGASGEYLINNSLDNFLLNKTVYYITMNNGVNVFFEMGWNNTNALNLKSYFNGNLDDNLMYKVPLTIRVYN